MAPRLGILLSGTGSTYANLERAIAEGRLRAEIAVVVSSRPGVGGLDLAARHGRPAVVATTPDAVTAALLAHRAEAVAMCGYLKFWDPPAEFSGRAFNIHPSLLPAFGGRGMFAKAGSTDVEGARRLIDIAVEGGINMLDTANVYSQGLSEEIVGEALGDKRDQVLIATGAWLGGLVRELAPRLPVRRVWLQMAQTSGS